MRCLVVRGMKYFPFPKVSKWTGYLMMLYFTMDVFTYRVDAYDTTEMTSNGILSEIPWSLQFLFMHWWTAMVEQNVRNYVPQQFVKVSLWRESSRLIIDYKNM